MSQYSNNVNHYMMEVEQGFSRLLDICFDMLADPRINPVQALDQMLPDIVSYLPSEYTKELSTSTQAGIKEMLAKRVNKDV